MSNSPQTVVVPRSYPIWENPGLMQHLVEAKFEPEFRTIRIAHPKGSIRLTPPAAALIVEQLNDALEHHYRESNCSRIDSNPEKT